MIKGAKFSYNFWAIVILAFYTIFQAVRWPLFPQHIDIYYHLLTAWGFIKAGGYTNWDFWQYAPIGRSHIYPPFFHIILALFIKAGINKILLAKIFNVAMPPLFLLVLWNFIRKNFSPSLAFFSLVTVSSSFSFYMSLTNHMPSTIAIIFGIIGMQQFINRRIPCAIILFTLCFYTHIGTAWFLLLSLLFYSLSNPAMRRGGLFVSFAVLAFSSPMFIQQLFNIKSIYIDPVYEKYVREYKIAEYIFAAFGIVFALRKKGKYYLFIAFFISSFIYIIYPSRFFSSEGYLAVALLAAVFLDALREHFAGKKFSKAILAFLLIFVLVISPTFAIYDKSGDLTDYKLFVFDSAIMNMAFPKMKERMISRTLWFKDYYDYAADIIQKNSEWDDIIYCPAGIVGVCLATVSERATANGLLSEMRSPGSRDPIADSRIIIMLKYLSSKLVKDIVERYQLVLIGENDIFLIYKNTFTKEKMRVRKAAIHFL